MLKNIKHSVRKFFNLPLNSVEAYDLWADIYDNGDENLVFITENEILDVLLEKSRLTGKIILDYGCGTGRNWAKLLKYNPAKIIGCDISPNMLEQLKNKYNGQEIYLLKRNQLPPVNPGSVDVIFSTLVAAQIRNIGRIFRAWNTMLKPGGSILVTDLHPRLLSVGGKRTFEKDGRIYEIKNYVHHLDKIEKICRGLGLEIIEIKESFITKRWKDFYAGKNALEIYERFYGLPLVYGILIGKRNDSGKS